MQWRCIERTIRQRKEISEKRRKEALEDVSRVDGPSASAAGNLLEQGTGPILVTLETRIQRTQRWRPRQIRGQKLNADCSTYPSISECAPMSTQLAIVRCEQYGSGPGVRLGFLHFR